MFVPSPVLIREKVLVTVTSPALTSFVVALDSARCDVNDATPVTPRVVSKVAASSTLRVPLTVVIWPVRDKSRSVAVVPPMASAAPEVMSNVLASVIA